MHKFAALFLKHKRAFLHLPYQDAAHDFVFGVLHADMCYVLKLNFKKWKYRSLIIPQYIDSLKFQGNRTEWCHSGLRTNNSALHV